MDREEVWDLYFNRLHSLISSARSRVEKLIIEETRKDLLLRWHEVKDEVIHAYSDTAVSFIEERLYAYELDHVDRFLQATSRGVSLREIALLEKSLSWYEWQKEKEAIDGKIETGLNLMQSAEQIVEGLLDEFGAFPDKTIINTYKKSPMKNYLPDYVLALALERVIRGRLTV